MIHGRITPDGTKYIGAHGGLLEQFPLSVAFDASSIGAVEGNFNPAELGAAWAWSYNADGTKIFWVEDTSGMLYQYSVTAPFDITGGVSYDSLSFDLTTLGAGLFTNAFTLQISGDNKYLILARGESLIDTYELTTAGTLAGGVSLVQTVDIKAHFTWGALLRGTWLDEVNKKFYAIGNSRLVEYDYTG